MVVWEETDRVPQLSAWRPSGITGHIGSLDQVTTEAANPDFTYFYNVWFINASYFKTVWINKLFWIFLFIYTT